MQFENGDNMTLKIVWGVTGSGDLLHQIFEVMDQAVAANQLKVTAVLSKAAVLVVKWYKLWDNLNSISEKVLIEKDANTPFIVGPLQTGKFRCLLVAPATANTVAKIVHGIADTIITNAVSQTNKSNTPIYILPVDRQKGKTKPILPGGESFELYIRDIDVHNTEILKEMNGIGVLNSPFEIKNILARVAEKK